MIPSLLTFSILLPFTLQAFLKGSINDDREYSVRCPSTTIDACDCVELDKGLDSHFEPNSTIDPHPDIIETIVFCKFFTTEETMIKALAPFHGHRINYLVINSCTLPPFPSNIFSKINILWMEIINSTIQFHESFFDCGSHCL